MYGMQCNAGPLKREDMLAVCTLPFISLKPASPSQLLKGLGSAPLATLMDSSAAKLLRPGDLTHSALPLWVFWSQLQQTLSTNASAANVPAQVQLNNVTLILPQSDYAALLAATQRDSNSPGSGAQHTWAVMSGIQVLEPGRPGSSHTQSANSFLLLKHYRGWGVEGINLILMPEAPLPACVSLPHWDLLTTGCGDDIGGDITPPDGSDAASNRRAIAGGIGAGVGVGVPLLLVAAGATALWLQRKRHEAYAMQKGARDRCVFVCAPM